MKLDAFLTYAEAGEILGLTPDTVREYCKRKVLKREYPMGKKAPFVTRASVKKYQRDRRVYERRIETAEPTNETEATDERTN